VANGARGSSRVSGRLTGHLAIGVLTSLIHRDIVDDVIRESGKREKRSRLLPANVVMYYVLALNLYFGEAYEEVMRQLVNGLRFLGNWRDNWEVPSTSAISQARTRLGVAPIKLLFERIAVPMARAGTRGAWFRGLRVMAIDGLVLDVPATPENDEEFGRSGGATAPSPFPRCGWSRWASAPRTGSSTPRSARSRPATHPRRVADRPVHPRHARARRPKLLQLSGLVAGGGERGAVAVAGLGEPAPAGAGVAARGLLPLGGDQPEGAGAAPRTAHRRRGGR
jgi:hypothetical protein